MVTRDKRLDDFITDRMPPLGIRVQLLFEDHVGTYTTQWLCLWNGEDWINERTGDRIVSTVLGWRKKQE